MHQNPVLSDQVLLDAPLVEGVMFNILFVYVRTDDVTQDFWFGSVIQNILKTQCKGNLHLGKFTNCNTQFSHNTSVIPITSLWPAHHHDAQPLQLLGKHMRGLKPSSNPLLFEILLLVAWLFIGYVGLSHTPAMLVWLNLGDFHTRNELREKHLHHKLGHSAVSFLHSFLCNSCALSQSALFCELHGHITLFHLLSLLPL